VKFPKTSEIIGDLCAGSNQQEDNIAGDSDNSKEHGLIAPNTASNNSASGFVDITETTWESAVDAT
jgi:hypothetical protein